MSEVPVIRILLEECNRIEERFDGYREELSDTLGEILLREKENMFCKSNIKQKVADQIEKVASLLSDARSQSRSSR